MHGIAAVYRQIQQGVFKLVAIGQHIPQIGAKDGVDPDRFAERAVQHLAHAVEQPPRVQHRRGEWLTAREGEQVSRQLCAAFYGLGGGGDAALGGRMLAGVGGQHLQVAVDHLQHVVEVVRDAAREAADRLHLLRLAQLRFGQRSRRDGVGDTLLERFGEQAQCSFGVLPRAFGEHAPSRFHDHGNHARRRTAVVGHRAVVQIHPHIFGLAIA